MTDQRPIDPSTLRDGDYIRAEGEGWAAEGYYYRREIRSKAGWNVVCLRGESDERVTVLRPVLVKGDRVAFGSDFDLLGTYDGPDDQGEPGNCWFTSESGIHHRVPLSSLTRLPAAPEPAPIEVGDWWTDEGGWPCVVVKIGPTGNPFLRRWTSEHPDKAPSPETLRAAWTRLDGPPEPPVGSVFVISRHVWANDGKRYRSTSPGLVSDSWDFLASGYSKAGLATLQIVHTLGVE